MRTQILRAGVTFAKGEVSTGLAVITNPLWKQKRLRGWGDGSVAKVLLHKPEDLSLHLPSGTQGTVAHSSAHPETVFAGMGGHRWSSRSLLASSLAGRARFRGSQRHCFKIRQRMIEKDISIDLWTPHTCTTCAGTPTHIHTSCMHKTNSIIAEK